MNNITYNKKLEMIYIQEFKGVSQYSNQYHFIRLLKIKHLSQFHKLYGKCFDCIPFDEFNENLECGDIVEVIFDKHSPRKNPQIFELKPTGKNIFKMNDSKLIDFDEE